MGDMLLHMYKRTQYKQNGNSSDKELIDISSDDDVSKVDSKLEKDVKTSEPVRTVAEDATPSQASSMPVIASKLEITCTTAKLETAAAKPEAATTEPETTLSCEKQETALPKPEIVTSKPETTPVTPKIVRCCMQLVI